MRAGSAAAARTSPRRILVVGSPGAGKSTFARALAVRTGLPVVHLDREYWRPGWVASPSDEWRARVAELVAGDAWILDGDYSATLPLRLARAQRVVLFDLPRRACLWGALSRWWAYRGRARPDLPAGCPERLDPAFLAWIWRYRERTRPRVLEALAGVAPEVEVIAIRSRVQARRALEAAAKTLGQGPAAAALAP